MTITRYILIKRMLQRPHLGVQSPTACSSPLCSPQSSPPTVRPVKSDSTCSLTLSVIQSPALYSIHACIRVHRHVFVCATLTLLCVTVSSHPRCLSAYAVPGAIYLGQELKFKAPVFVGERVKATVTVRELQTVRSGARV